MPGINQIPAELIQVGSKTFLSEIQKRIIPFGIRKYYYISGRNLLLYLFLKRAHQSKHQECRLIKCMELIGRSKKIRRSRCSSIYAIVLFQNESREV